MFKKYLPIILSLLTLLLVALILINKKNENKKNSIVKVKKILFQTFSKQQSCIQHPKFLSKLGVTQPITIDLSQQQFIGLAFLYGQNFSKVVHPQSWETFEHFSTYALDKKGDIYLAPMPFISIKPSTFNLQKNIYKLDSITGKLSIFMHFEDVLPSASNPYGIISLVYDCDDETLWVSAIDESNYRAEKGVIYHIDIKSKRVLQRLKNVDALTLKLLKTKTDKFLLFGSARKNALYAYSIKKSMLFDKKNKLFSLPSASEHIRKIRIIDENTLEIEVINFTYSLVSETSLKRDRKHYRLFWNSNLGQFEQKK